MAIKTQMAAAALGLLGVLISSTASAAEIKCPPSVGDVTARVVPQVTYDPNSQTFTYRYTLHNLPSSRLDVDGLSLEVPREVVRGEPRIVPAPEGWAGMASQGSNGTPDVTDWYANKVKNPNKITDNPSIPKDLSALEPGGTLSGFVLKSRLPPGPSTAYLTGQVENDPVSSEREMERMYRECETVGKTMFEAARKVRTAGPAQGDFRPVQIDILPGSKKNPVNPKQKGVVPVAVMGSNSLAVSQLDPATFRFGPGGAPPAHRSHETRDIDGDGLLDLLVHFDVGGTGVACMDSVAFLQGRTVEGNQVQGFDSISVPSCRQPGTNKGGSRKGD